MSQIVKYLEYWCLMWNIQWENKVRRTIGSMYCISFLYNLHMIKGRGILYIWLHTLPLPSHSSALAQHRLSIGSASVQHPQHPQPQPRLRLIFTPAPSVNVILASVQLQGFSNCGFSHGFRVIVRRRWQAGAELKLTHLGMKIYDWSSPKMDRWAWRVETTRRNGDVLRTFGYICMIVKDNEFWIVLLFNIYYGELH